MAPQATQTDNAPGLGVPTPGETPRRQSAKATRLPDPRDREGRSDSAPKINTGEERILRVRTTQKDAPSPDNHLREAAHKGTNNPTQGVGPPRGFTTHLQEAAHQGDFLPTRKTGGPTIGIYYTTPKRGWLDKASRRVQPTRCNTPPKRPAPLASACDRSAAAQWEALLVSEETGALSRCV